MRAHVKKIPQRRCCGCGESYPKKELIRVVRTPDGSVALDFTGKASGRGAYLCEKSACFKRARKTNRIASSLEIQIPEELYDRLESEIRHAEAQAENR